MNILDFNQNQRRQYIFAISFQNMGVQCVPELKISTTSGSQMVLTTFAGKPILMSKSDELNSDQTCRVVNAMGKKQQIIVMK